MINLLAGTILLRPYVFLFLLAYLALAVPAWGWRRTASYALLGYVLACLAEYSSIHNGFPFGLYTYISGPTAKQELWVAGVPFMDSLSFVFLTFTGLQLARLMFEPLARGPRGRWDLRWAQPAASPRWYVWASAGLLTMGMDVIIDPLALRGGKWFLGQIFYYPPGGEYFGVPITNFLGWALLSWIITSVFLLLENRFFNRIWGVWRGYPADALGGMGLFIGVMVFNLTITFAIGEITLALASSLIFLGMLAPLLARLRRVQTSITEVLPTRTDPLSSAE
ncbi:MAG TPA: carotenoid biosynthesis protein [Anaerolineales bacterium]|jgi:putative membrane protein|nr:carotenoid biosynthesis protein [Anaerolineales bacterium]